MPGQTDCQSGYCTLAARGTIVLLPIVLTACQPAVLDPQGIIGIAEKTILIDSLAIMLAIVIPTIATTFAFAWWFRASNTRARYLPDFVYSGRLELIVWAIPLLVIMLLGGVSWIGSHDLDPAKPLASNTPPLEVQVVSLDWKWLFIYPEQHVASVNQLVVPAGVPVHFSLTSASVMNAFFIPQLRQHDLHDERHDDAVEPAGGRARHVPRPNPLDMSCASRPTNWTNDIETAAQRRNGHRLDAAPTASPSWTMAGD